MAKCQFCSAKLPEDSNFCPNCGTRVNGVRKEEISVSSEELVATIKRLIQEGNVTRIVIKDEEGKLLLDMPVTVGVLGVLFAPWLAAIGTIAALATRCTIVVERR